MANEAKTGCADTEPNADQPAPAADASTEASTEASAKIFAAQDSDAVASVESLRAALEAAQTEVEAQRDRALRAAAEVENVRKRADRSIENAHKFALEGFIAGLLPAVDSFQRAAKAACDTDAEDEAMAATAEGIELSLKLLLETMERHGVKAVDPIGAPFDPALHEAMSAIDNPEAEPGSVIEVFQKGYTLNGRLVRAARVIVARQPAASDPSTPEKP